MNNKYHLGKNSIRKMNQPGKNDEENEIIQKFRKRVSDVIKAEDTDHFLYRWLTYADFDLVESERTLRTCLLCRSCQQIDGLSKTFVVPEVWKKYGFSDFIGFSKDGIPVRYMPVGKSDYDGLLRSLSTVTMDRLCGYLINCDMDSLHERDKKMGRVRDEGQLIIFDLEGFSLQQFAHKHVLECLIDLMKMYQDYYTAGVVKLIIVTNAPFYYPLVVNLFRPILRSTILEKIRIYSKASTSDALLRLIDAEELPEFLGGKKVDKNGDPECSAFVSKGGIIPSNYHYRSHPHIPMSGPDVLEINIRARGHYDHPAHVTTPKSIIRIAFESNNSIGLSVYYNTKLIKRNGEESQEEDVCCSPYSRIQSHLVPEEMDLYCENPGTYIFRFDNSYCWTQTKHLLFKMEILPPTTKSSLTSKHCPQPLTRHANNIRTILCDKTDG